MAVEIKFAKLAVEIWCARFAVETIEPKTIVERYPAVPKPITVDIIGPPNV